MVHNDHELWCFLFVTLFNLQGACRLRRNIAIISAFRRFVNCFFSPSRTFSFAVSQAFVPPDSFVRLPKDAGKVNPLLSNLCIFSSFFCFLHHFSFQCRRITNIFNNNHYLYLWIFPHFDVPVRHFHSSCLFICKKTAASHPGTPPHRSNFTGAPPEKTAPSVLAPCGRQ